jgi:hypothetical protein
MVYANVLKATQLDYRFVLDHPEACSSATDRDVVVIVTTAADSFEAR